MDCSKPGLFEPYQFVIGMDLMRTIFGDAVPTMYMDQNRLLKQQGTVSVLI